MPLTRYQIEEFTRRAREAGLADDEIASEIQRKARELGGSSNAISQSYSGRPQISTNTTQTRQPVDIPSGGGGGFVSNLIKGIVQPGVDYLKFVFEAPVQGARFALSPTFRKAVLGEKLTEEEEKELAQMDTTFFVDEEKLKDRGEIIKTGAKAIAGGASYAIPFGRGASLTSKVFVPGAVSGALSEVSREDATFESVTEAGVTGAATAGVLEGVGGMISWAKGKNGELIRKAEALDEGTRKIKVKASVFGASKEKAINKTLDKYGFKGTAQDQYEMLEPTLNEIEGKIGTFIQENPDLAVSKESIREAFMKNLRSSLRTKDLTKKAARDEIEGYLNDLLLAAGDVGEETGQELLKSGKAEDIPLATLREMKKILNGDSQSVFKKLENGTTLNSREKVILAAWDSLDDAIKGVAPEVKELLLDESRLYQAAQPLSSARFNPPVQRIMGTSVPAGITQKLRDMSSSVLKKLGLVAEELPEQNILQNPKLQRLAAMTPAALKERGLTDEEIQQVTELTSSLSNPPVAELGGQPESPMNTVQATPSPLNPFGSLTKRQVLSLALSEGATASDLKEIEAVYDMLTPEDPQMVSTETMQVADSLRGEYFKRSQENNWSEIVSSYEKVINTTNTAAGDVSLIFSFMKMLDPGSVVREGEFATAENTAGIPEQIVNQYNKALKGKKLSDKQRDAFKREAGQVFQVYQERQAQIDAYYQGLAQRYGIDPTLLGVGLYGR